MTPLNEEQLRHIHDERQEQIMLAALKVFSKYGIVGTKMNMITTEAGVSQGLFYRYFQSKNELFTILIHVAMKKSISYLSYQKKKLGF